MGRLLEKTVCAADVKALEQGELAPLAKEVRERIVECIAQTGGHLASSLGAVELAIGLLRVFEPPKDKVVWDVGHQAYAWKILTGRNERFGTIRTKGGLSGFPNPDESECDAFVAGHAGVALAAAEGMAAAKELGAKDVGHVVAVVGDAAMTNGGTLEALNNVAQMKGKVILVLNDNEMSISRNVGGFARFLGRLITGVRYNRVKAAAEAAGHKLKLTFLRKPYHRIEQMVKSIWLGNAFFENFGLRYIGPVDGHDLKAVEAALTSAREDKRSVVVHVCTVKGKGFAAAEHNPSAWHGVGKFDPASGGAQTSGKKDWSATFGEILCRMAEEDERVCAITAAMRTGTGLQEFAMRFPARFFDSGICEAHAATFAAGLAKSGMRPVAAIYSTFLQRAIDQVMHDACLLKLPVIFAVDRAGVVGADGRTHQGVFDIALLKALPGMTIMQPADAADLERMMKLALRLGTPCAIRYPRGVPPAVDFAPPESDFAPRRLRDSSGSIMIASIGPWAQKALKAAELLAKDGLDARVVDMRFIKPLDVEFLRGEIASGVRCVATLEDGAVAGGFGESVAAALAGSNVKMLNLGWPDEFIRHGPQDALAAEHGLDAESIARRIRDAFCG